MNLCLICRCDINLKIKYRKCVSLDVTLRETLSHLCQLTAIHQSFYICGKCVILVQNIYKSKLKYETCMKKFSEIYSNGNVHAEVETGDVCLLGTPAPRNVNDNVLAETESRKRTSDVLSPCLPHTEKRRTDIFILPHTPSTSNVYVCTEKRTSDVLSTHTPSSVDPVIKRKPSQLTPKSIKSKKCVRKYIIEDTNMSDKNSASIPTEEKIEENNRDLVNRDKRSDKNLSLLNPVLPQPSSEVEFKAKILYNFPKGVRSKVIKRKFLQQICCAAVSYKENRFFRRVANFVYKEPTLKKHIVSKLFHELEVETSKLCQVKNPSLLRKKDAVDLEELSTKDIMKEWQERAPLFYKMLKCVSNIKDESSPDVSLAGCILLRSKNIFMNRFQHCLGLMLDAAGLKNETITVLNKLNMCVSTTTIQRKKHELVHRYDGMLHDIKTELEEEENCGKISISGDGGMNKIDESEMQSLNMNRPIGCPDDAGCLPVHHTKNSTCVTSKYIEGINVSQTINSFDNVVKNEQVIDIDITPFEVDDEKKNTVTHSDSQENVAEDEAPSLMHNDIDNEDVLDEFNQPAVNFDNYDQEHGPFLLQRVEPMSF